VNQDDSDVVLARRVSRVLGLMLMAGAVVVPYVVERRYRRWEKEGDAYAGLKTFVSNSRTNLRGKREGASEFTRFVNEVFSEVERQLKEIV